MDVTHPRPIAEVAATAGIDASTLIPYGHHTAKVPLGRGAENVPLVMVTAITPTPLGEGKTTTAIGVAQALARIGRRPVLTLRQPSLGPTFGIKGGAAGAGASQVIPSELLNLHLTGDFHAITAAHNLLAAMIDNHLHHGNALDIDPHSITWPRVLDVNDRALRHVVAGLGRKVDGVPRQTSFDITAASEVMTIMALATDHDDLRARLGRIVIGFTRGGETVTADDLQAAGAMCVLLRDALLPNLMQTTEGTPALIHTGPFGNIATGNSSVVADLVGQRLGDIVITESGFGADLGAERMINVKSRVSGIDPALALVVVTVRALKAHSGGHRIVPGKPLPPELGEENPDDVLAGCANLDHHLRIIRRWGIPAVVAINAFPDDHPSEHEVIARFCSERGVPAAVSRHVAEGGTGAEDLARLVVAQLARPGTVQRDYDLDAPLVDKIQAVADRVHGASGVDIAAPAARDLQRFTDLGYGNLPVLIAKTHLSTTADPKADGSLPWRLPVREVRLAAGAGYVYALTGAVSTMPGLPSHPNAERIDLADGQIVGLS